MIITAPQATLATYVITLDDKYPKPPALIPDTVKPVLSDH